jgi:hypothetical protein
MEGYSVQPVLKTLITAISIVAPLSCAHAADTNQHYRAIGVADFSVDAPSLARARAHVKISGSYAFYDGLERLFADQYSLTLSRYAPNAGVRPSVILETDNASHSLRERLQSCQANPYATCQVVILGTAGFCVLSNAFGVVKSTPCLHAEDRDQAEELAQTQRVQAEHEANEIKEAAERVEANRQAELRWDERMTECLGKANLNDRYAWAVYSRCTAEIAWPNGLTPPAFPLPSIVQTAIDVCLRGRPGATYLLCTDNDPPPAAQ